MMRVELNNVTKTFKIGFDKNHSFLSRIIYAISGKEPQKELQVLKNITLKIEAGKGVGVIGLNGAGKSTLLRVIAEIYQKDSGTIKINGKIVSLVGLNLHDRLTMSENIYLIGSLYGLNKKTIEERFNSIVKFAELEKFKDTKLHQFSTGMVRRLVTSIIVHSDGDIILLDDVDSVTDKAFTEKYLKKGRELINSRKVTILIVSHNVDLLKKCDEVIWLDNGQIKQYGEKNKVINSYLESIKNDTKNE